MTPLAEALKQYALSVITVQGCAMSGNHGAYEIAVQSLDHTSELLAGALADMSFWGELGRPPEPEDLSGITPEILGHQGEDQ